MVGIQGGLGAAPSSGAAQVHHTCRASVTALSTPAKPVGMLFLPNFGAGAALTLQFPWLVQKNLAEALAHLTLLAAAKSTGSGLAANDAGLQLTSPTVLRAGTLQGTFLGL